MINAFDVYSKKLIDFIIIAEDANYFIAFQFAKQFFRALKKAVKIQSESHVYVTLKASKKSSLRKIILSGGAIGFLKPIRSLEAVISWKTFRRYLTAL